MLLAGLLASGTRLRADTEAAPTAPEIVERMVAGTREASERLRLHGLAYTRRTVVEELDDHAAVRDRKTREHSVTIVGGRTRSVLVRLDGKPPSPKEHGVDRDREAEHRRSAANRRGRKGEPDFLDESLLRRFDYELAGEETMAGRRVHVLRFEPKPGDPDAGEIADRFIGRLHGLLWVDAEEFELVKVESHLKSPLTILGGIAASLTRVDLVVERARLAPGLWMNRHLSTYAEGRKVLSSLRMRVEVDQDGFHEIPVTPAVP